VLLVLLATAIRDARTETQRSSARILIALLVVGSFGAIADITRGVSRGFDLSPPRLEQVTHVDDGEPKWLAAQLFADGKSFFWKFVAKPVQRQ
jgi:hypothetical protein